MEVHLTLQEQTSYEFASEKTRHRADTGEENRNLCGDNPNSMSVPSVQC